MLDFLRRLKSEVSEDNVGEYASALAYKGLFVIFPLLVLTASMLGLFDASNLINKGVDWAGTILPAPVVSLIQDNVLGLISTDGSLLGVGALISTGVALWGVSGAFKSIMLAMNVMYDAPESRGFVKTTLISLGMSLASVALLGGALGLIIFGSWIGLSWLSYIFVPLLALVAFAVIYYVAPNVEQKFRWITPGSLFAGVGWLGFSVLFKLYVDSFGSYNETYGALASVVVFLLYLYWSAFILLLGAQINQILIPVVSKDKGIVKRLLDK